MQPSKWNATAIGRVSLNWSHAAHKRCIFYKRSPKKRQELLPRVIYWNAIHIIKNYIFAKCHFHKWFTVENALLLFPYDIKDILTQNVTVYLCHSLKEMFHWIVFMISYLQTLLWAVYEINFTPSQDLHFRKTLFYKCFPVENALLWMFNV